jgi:hypothetical protein
MLAAEEGSEFAKRARTFSEPASTLFCSEKTPASSVAEEISEEKTSPLMLSRVKISSQKCSGDFGAGVVCARLHHFFLDITF